jgi:gas vesicle protein
MSTESKIIVGFAAAALTGIGIGMLLAPYSGPESREKLRKGTNDIANRLLDAINTNGQALKERAGEVVDQAKNAYNQVKGEAKSEVENAKKELSRAV